MKKRNHITFIAAIALMICFASSLYADNILFPSNNTPIVNETETTGAFGANQAFTLEESDITDVVIEKNLTKQTIKEIEKKLENKTNK